jgi:hypothetical protein
MMATRNTRPMKDRPRCLERNARFFMLFPSEAGHVPARVSQKMTKRLPASVEAADTAQITEVHPDKKALPTMFWSGTKPQ